MVALARKPRPVTMMTFGITGPVSVRVVTAHHTCAIRWNIAALTAITTLGITNQAVAAKLPAVRFTIPVPALPLVPLITLGALPLPAVMVLRPMTTLSLIPLVIAIVSALYLMPWVLLVLRNSVTGRSLVAGQSGPVERTGGR